MFILQIKIESTDKGENKKDNKHSKMSSSGRLVRPPKRILTSSSDEAPKRKKNVWIANLPCK